ncbi:MAG: polyprenyl synthetase family protein, partial [Saprospiraceae bacterium]|nr:polyprenyl synthetase family protein [Saprospiraceae bacterium]
MQSIENYKSAFEAYLNQEHFSKEPAGLYEPVNYILRLGGKRLRPLLALMGRHVFADDFQPALPVAMAVELFHNFSLIHDDIMDEAPLRRGNPTVHHRFGLNSGILSGDVMLIYAQQYLLDAGDATLSARLLKSFNRCAIQVCEGQQWDIDFESMSLVSIPQYLHMIEYKTAVLLACSLEMGAMTAGASDTDLHHLYEFGRNLGIAFQLQDDFLDTFGDAGKFGKKPGGDIVQNKKTFLILKALELADAPAKEKLTRLMNTPTNDEQEKIQEVMAILRQFEVPVLAKEERNQFHRQAMAHLDQVSAPEAQKSTLYQ